jgi:hypothetical protein
MPSLDERLRHDLQRAARPADPTGVYEELIRRRERRRIARRVGSSAIAIVVLAGTLTGVYVLSKAFRSGPTTASSPSPRTSTNDSPSPSTGEGSEVGLPYRLCDVSALHPVDLLGDGTPGTAWTGTRERSDGTCPDRAAGPHLVAIDVTGDGLADDAWDALRDCIVCRPYAATDLDADGDRELVVLAQLTSTPQFVLFSLQTDPDGMPRLRPVTVAAPGHPAARVTVGSPLAIWTGGDEGFTGAVGCENYPAGPVQLVVAWANHPVDGPGSEVREVHVTSFSLTDRGTARVIDFQDFTEPTGDPLPPPFDSGDRACGVDFNRFR